MKKTILVISCLVFSNCVSKKLKPDDIKEIKSTFSRETLEYFQEIVFNTDLSEKTKLTKWEKYIYVELYVSLSF